MEQGFAARVGRIRTGQTYRAEDLLWSPGRGRRGRRLPLTQRPNFRFGVLVAFSGLVTALMVDPSVLPEPLRHLLQPDGLAAYADASGLSQLIAMIPGL